jgi:hypothetical protein
LGFTLTSTPDTPVETPPIENPINPIKTPENPVKRPTEPTISGFGIGNTGGSGSGSANN